METISQDEDIKVIGMEIKTSNDKAFEEIPMHWQKFMQESMMEKIPNKMSNDIYAVYTNFENEGKNNDGVYSFIIGARVSTLKEAPEAFVSTTIPKSKRRVYPVEKGHPEKVGEKWQEIWKATDIYKTYVADYERYKENGEIAVFVGIK